VCSLLGRNAPLIQDAHLKAEEAGYRVLGVAVQDSRGALRSLSESMGLSFPMVLDGDNAVGIAYHVVGPPSTFFIDANGKIISVVAGPIEEDTLEQELAKLLGFGDTHVVPEIGPIEQGLRRGLAPNEP